MPAPIIAASANCIFLSRDMENKEIELEFSIKSGAPEKQRTACVVVGVFESRKLSGPAIDIDRASDGYLSEILRGGDMDGRAGSTLAAVARISSSGRPRAARIGIITFSSAVNAGSR